MSLYLEKLAGIKFGDFVKRQGDIFFFCKILILAVTRCVVQHVNVSIIIGGI